MVSSTKIFLKQLLNKLDNWLKKKKKMRTIRTTPFFNCLIITLLVLIFIKFIFEIQFKSSNIRHVEKIHLPEVVFKATTFITTTTTKKTIKKKVKESHREILKITTKSVEDTCVRNLSSSKGHNNTIDKMIYSFEDIETNLKENFIKLSFGGVSKTESNNKCQTSINTAIIIPYRDRLLNLKVFLNNMHRILTRQKINYGIFLVEPVQNATFNRGILMNIGFKEVISIENNYNFNCYIFHDVDMLPEDERLVYDCNQTVPKHFATAVSKWNYRTTGYFSRYFGGINGFTKQQFERINGFSNMYFNWGGEDDDLLKRSLKKFPVVERVNKEIGRFTMVSHKTAPRNPERYDILWNKNRTLHVEGLNNLNYELKKIEKNLLFTHFFVDYDKNYFLTSE